MPKPVDKDARLLGLALLHGYLGAGDLETAAREDPRPSAILKALRASNVLDEPCIQGLEQSLEELGSDPSLPPETTSSTRAAPHLGPDSTGVGVPRVRPLDSSAEDSPENLILRKLTIARWKQYRHLRFIGEGGMGRIFKAVDPDLNRTVALKFLRGQDPGQLKRFLFEAQAQALVDHPNICQVHEVSEWQGQHYIAMQYVNGPTLSKVREELTPAQTLEIMETVAEAVHAAHCRGLIHRDLKPTNILVEKDEAGRLKPFVLDFGLARDATTRDFTVSGLVVGTTAYMAPEQARGEAHHIDRRTDVYSLGATIYELFAGCPPYGDAKGIDCLRRVVEEDPPPLRSRAPAVHPDLATIVTKCLEKDPARRYDDAQALADDLRRFRDGDPIRARPATLGYRLGKFARKNRLLVAVSGLASAALLLLTGVAAYARINASARELAAQHFGQEAERIEAMLGFARRLPVQDIEPYLEKARQRLVQLQTEASQSRGSEAGTGAFAVGRVLVAFGEMDQALPHLEKAEQVGLRTPELASALGRCYAAIYQRELERARRINPEEGADSSSREARVRRVEQQWRDPALKQLRRARDSGADFQESLEALVDWYEGRLDLAVEKARAAIRKDPYNYQAKGFEGELILAQARRARDKDMPDQAMALIQEAVLRFREARRVAPSDTSLWLGEAKCQVERLRTVLARVDVPESLELCRAAATACQQIRPHDITPLSQVALALHWAGLRQDLSGQDAEPSFLEGIEVTAKVLEQTPADLDSHSARIGLFQALGRYRRDRGGDSGWAFEQALVATRIALDRFPGDWLLLTNGVSAAQSLFTWECSVGRDSERSFQEALGMAANMVRLEPDQAPTQTQMATLLVERAEFDRLHGRDPRPSITTAQAHLERARELGVSKVSYLGSMGDCALILAQHAFALGEDPDAHLERALDHYRRRMETANPFSGFFGSYAEACFYKSIAEIQKGRDPAPWVARMEESLAHGLAIKPQSWLVQLRGQSQWLKARVDSRLGRDPRGHFLEALGTLKRATESSRESSAFRWLARVHLDQARSFPPGYSELQQGIRAAESASRLDPTSGEALFLLGQLRLLAADCQPSPKREVLAKEALGKIEQAVLRDGNLQLRVQWFLKARGSLREIDP